MRRTLRKPCLFHYLPDFVDVSPTSKRPKRRRFSEDLSMSFRCFFPLNWKRLWFCKQIVWLNHLISWSIRYNSKIPIVTCIVTYSWLIAMIYLHSNEMKHMSHMKQVFSMKIAMAMCLKISRFRSWETAPCPLWEFASKKLAANALHWRQGGVASLEIWTFGRCILDILVQFFPFGGIEGKERHWLHVGQRWELGRGF